MTTSMPGDEIQPASIPPQVKKTNKRKWILIGAGVLAGLCVICLGIGLVASNSPTFKATMAANTAVAAVAEPTKTAAPQDVATKPPEATRTRRPTNTPAATKTLIPTLTPAPTRTSTPAPEPIELSGDGDQIVDVDIPFEFGVAHFVYGGARNFIVNNYNKDNEVIGGLVNEIGSYDGVRPIDFLKGEKTTRLEIQASAPWKITIYPLTKDYLHVCQVPGPCTGKGDDVVLLMGGTADTAKILYSGEHNFIINGYGGEYVDGMVNEIGTYEGTVMFTKGTFILEIISSGDWTIDITGK